jgi:hypothetical protein
MLAGAPSTARSSATPSRPPDAGRDRLRLRRRLHPGRRHLGARRHTAPILDGHALALAARLTAGWLLGLDLGGDLDGDDPAPVANSTAGRDTTVSWEWPAGDGSGAG